MQCRRQKVLFKLATTWWVLLCCLGHHWMFVEKMKCKLLLYSYSCSAFLQRDTRLRTCWPGVLWILIITVCTPLFCSFNKFRWRRFLSTLRIILVADFCSFQHENFWNPIMCAHVTQESFSASLLCVCFLQFGTIRFLKCLCWRASKLWELMKTALIHSP